MGRKRATENSIGNQQAGKATKISNEKSDLASWQKSQMKIADFGERQKTQMKISYNQKTPVKESDPWPVLFCNLPQLAAT